MWDPRNRPTSAQALNHEYFTDAVDPLRPKSSASRLLGRKMSEKSFTTSPKEATASAGGSVRASWFRRSLVARSDSPAPLADAEQQSARPSMLGYNTMPAQQSKEASAANKRATWANGAPMPILPSIRPVSPLSNAVTAQANSTLSHDHSEEAKASTSKKIGRQLSVNSHGNHYVDLHRQEAERALNGVGSGAPSPTPQKESFFSHLRKRARRLSGRNQGGSNYDVEANAGCAPWSNRSSVALDSLQASDAKIGELSDLDQALQSIKYGSESSSPPAQPTVAPNNTLAKRQSVPNVSLRSTTESANPTAGPAPSPSRTWRATQMSQNPVHRYETPEEEDELLDEALHCANTVASRLAHGYEDDSSTVDGLESNQSTLVNASARSLNPYPTPSPSAKRDGVSFGHRDLTPTGADGAGIGKREDDTSSCQWPTPPYGDDEWASTVAASILASGSHIR